MNRLALALTVLATPAVVLVAVLGGSDLVPFGLAPAMAGLGGGVAIAGAGLSRPRVHGAGVAGAIVGVSLTGVALSTPLVALGVAGTALLVASLTLHLALPTDEGGLALALAALLGASIVAGLALLVRQAVDWLAGGGADAGGVAAWLVLLAAASWGLHRWTREEARPE